MMKQAIVKALVCLPAILMAAEGVSADSWTCRKADLTRQVTVFYPEAPALLPCKVFYTKPNENVLPRPLWEADNTEGYCERKAAEFVGRLTSWGWNCEQDASEQAANGESTEAAAPNSR
jgi:hypothetical protein